MPPHSQVNTHWGKKKYSLGSHLPFCSAIFVFYIYRPSLYHTAMEVLVIMYAVNTRKVKKKYIHKLYVSVSQFEKLSLTK